MYKNTAENNISCSLTAKYLTNFGNMLPIQDLHFFKSSLKVYMKNEALSIEPEHDKNQQNNLCTQRRLRSAWAAQSDQSSLCAQWVVKDPVLLHADSEYSDQSESSLGA